MRADAADLDIADMFTSWLKKHTVKVVIGTLVHGSYKATQAFHRMGTEAAFQILGDLWVAHPVQIALRHVLMGERSQI